MVQDAHKVFSAACGESYYQQQVNTARHTIDLASRAKLIDVHISSLLFSPLSLSECHEALAPSIDSRRLAIH